jgi:hypothetical protein
MYRYLSDSYLAIFMKNFGIMCHRIICFATGDGGAERKHFACGF